MNTENNNPSAITPIQETPLKAIEAGIKELEQFFACKDVYTHHEMLEDNKKNLELYTYMVSINFESSTAEQLISELSQFERTKDFFTPNKN